MFADGYTTRDGARRYVGSGGDLYVVELPSGRFRALTRTQGPEQLVGMSGDERTLYYRDATNVFAFELGTGAIRQLTDQPLGTPVPNARIGLVSGFGMITYDRGLASGAAVLARAA